MLLGHLLSGHLDSISQAMNKFSVIIIVLLLIAVIHHFWKGLHHED